ncbi:MASE4 domain-containing protein [Terrarubrum flagellatum]|uniref:MASE4 domain-containing protein n=1 Tax=Terrirubrum flagellatum TaxID=2895980 RepID=UPI0031450F38
MVVNDLITAVLLFGQFRIARSRALLIVGCGYLFTALMCAVHAMTFPGLFAETGLLGAGRQTTAWLYMFWHAGFPLAVVGYALLIGRPHDRARSEAHEIALGIAAVIALTVASTVLATAGESLLPSIMLQNRYAPAQLFIVGVVWLLCGVALVTLWRRRERSTLDLWLMVVLVAWLCDVALSALLNAGRFDLGFYSGRILGLLASSFVLMVLLLEVRALYVRLALSLAAENRERERRLVEMRATLSHISRLSEIGQMASALVHEINQPVTAIANYIDAGRRMIAMGSSSDLPPLFEKTSAQARRATELLRRFRDFGRKGEIIEREEDLRNAIVEIAQLALVGPLKRDAMLELQIRPDASRVVVDKIQIQQVLLNLIRNAAEAMADAPERRIVIAAERAGEDRVEISVADTGPGLPVSVREKLFQPFVTTKETGMGVGLSICQGIIEAHGGVISAADRPGGGAVFRFTVPRAESEIEDAGAAA